MLLKTPEFNTVFPGVSFDTSIHTCPMLFEGSLSAVSRFLLCSVWYFPLFPVMAYQPFLSEQWNCKFICSRTI